MLERFAAEDFFNETPVLQILETENPQGIPVESRLPIYRYANAIVANIDSAVVHYVSLAVLLHEINHDQHRQPVIGHELKEATVSLLQALRDAYAALTDGCHPKDVDWCGRAVAPQRQEHAPRFGAPASHAHRTGDFQIPTTQAKRNRRAQRTVILHSESDNSSTHRGSGNGSSRGKGNASSTSNRQGRGRGSQAGNQAKRQSRSVSGSRNSNRRQGNQPNQNSSTRDTKPSRRTASNRTPSQNRDK